MNEVENGRRIVDWKFNWWGKGENSPGVLGLSLFWADGSKKFWGLLWGPNRYKYIKRITFGPREEPPLRKR